ncbi:MAG: PfkB family carbohydrate kinase [Chloroflexota bacterium]
MAAFDIIVLGDYFYDLIYTGLTEFPELGREVFSTDVTTTGGAMYITAVSLRRLGVRVGWPAYFGNDYYSRSVYDFARAEDLDLSLAKHVDAPYRRVTTAIPLHGERAFVTFTDPEAPDLHRHWLEALEKTEFRHVHLASLDCPERLKPVAELARVRGATVSVDCGDGPHLKNPAQCRERLAEVDIFMPNAREARIIAETETVDEALVRLSELVPTIVIKDGARGSMAIHNGIAASAPAISAGEVIDTTGAGDCFNAGFLTGFIIDGAPLETCLRMGNICGGLSVTGVGGATAAPTRAQLDEWLARA